MTECLEFVVIQIQIDDLMFDVNGYCIREELRVRYGIKDFHYVDEDQVILPFPIKSDKRFCMNELEETIKSVTDATIYRVAVNVDFANQKITTIHVNY